MQFRVGVTCEDCKYRQVIIVPQELWGQELMYVCWGPDCGQINNLNFGQNIKAPNWYAHIENEI